MIVLGLELYALPVFGFVNLLISIPMVVYGLCSRKNNRILLLISGLIPLVSIYFGFHLSYGGMSVDNNIFNNMIMPDFGQELINLILYKYSIWINIIISTVSIISAIIFYFKNINNTNTGAQ